MRVLPAVLAIIASPQVPCVQAQVKRLRNDPGRNEDGDGTSSEWGIDQKTLRQRSTAKFVRDNVLDTNDGKSDLLESDAEMEEIAFEMMFSYGYNRTDDFGYNSTDDFGYNSTDDFGYNSTDDYSGNSTSEWCGKGCPKEGYFGALPNPGCKTFYYCLGNHAFASHACPAGTVSRRLS
jgi:hypothetical protein